MAESQTTNQNAVEPFILFELAGTTYGVRSQSVQQVELVEYITPVPVWDASHDDLPVLNGQHFQLVGSPNRYRLPALYELHVWAWRENPNGTFVDWNPRVSCDGAQ